jgi:alanine-synthesizing transaminase
MGGAKNHATTLSHGSSHAIDVPPRQRPGRGRRRASPEDLRTVDGSLSKTYSMPGWRIGFCAGNERLIAALARVKSYLDYGAFMPIQVAATAALNGLQACVEEMRARYRGRRDVLVEGLNAAGWDVPMPPASMFAWAPLPARFRDLGSLEFAKLLVKEARVAVSPGVGFGEYGEGHVRLALVENEHRMRHALRNIRAFLRSFDSAGGAPSDVREKRRNAS